jgi:peroxiredoxin
MISGRAVDLRPSRWRWWAQIATGVALLLAVRTYTLRGVASGPAPALVGRDLDGHAVSLVDLSGKPVMVHFWATWCPVCRAESGSIDALAREHPVVTVATSSGQAESIRAAMNQSGVRFPVVVDAGGDIARAWGVSRFPTSFFLGTDRRIRYAESGFTTGIGLRARLWLAGL